MTDNMTDERIDRLKRKYAETGDFPRFTEYLMRDATKNSEYIRKKAMYSGTDEKLLAEKNEALRTIYEKQRQGQISRMNALNEYYRNSGLTVGIRNDPELYVTSVK